jgi:hypothetical protein
MKKRFVALFLFICSLAFGQEYSDVPKDHHLTFPDALYCAGFLPSNTARKIDPKRFASFE